jgi:hypothetical protein
MNLLRRAQRLDDHLFGSPPESPRERLVALAQLAQTQRTLPGITAQAVLDLSVQIEALRDRVEQLEAGR